MAQNTLTIFIIQASRIYWLVLFVQSNNCSPFMINVNNIYVSTATRGGAGADNFYFRFLSLAAIKLLCLSLISFYGDCLFPLLCFLRVHFKLFQKCGRQQTLLFCVCVRCVQSYNYESNSTVDLYVIFYPILRLIVQ